MKRLTRFLLLFTFSLLASANEEVAQQTSTATEAATDQGVVEVEKVSEPTRTKFNPKKPLPPIPMEPLVQRYFLDEILNIRKDIGNLKAEMVREFTDRQMTTMDHVLTVNKTIQDYAINIINYFFYCIAVVVSILTLVGWRSLADIKKNATQFAANELNKLIRTYEDRLDDIEKEIKEKSRFVSKNYEFLRSTNEKNSIWLKVHTESDLKKKLDFLDEILAIDMNDVEAMTYKAHVAIQLQEYVWALTLCNTALSINPEHAHAIYQKACVYARLGDEDKAYRFLEDALKISQSFKVNARTDESFAKMADEERFMKLVG